jgi:hypothetical protein
MEETKTETKASVTLEKRLAYAGAVKKMLHPRYGTDCLRVAAVSLLLTALLAMTAFAEIYHWIDDQGTQYYTTDPDNIPERYRSRAQSFFLPPPPAPPPELQVVTPPKEIITVSFQPGSSVLVSAKINGAGPIPLILDTGADRTLITVSALRNLGLSMENSVPMTLGGVTGVSRGSAIWVDSVEIAEAKVGPIQIAIYDTNLKDADGLLGRDFLVHFNFSIDSKLGTLTLEPHNK